MEKVSNFISKKVISIEEGNALGYVLNVIFDERVKTMLGLVVVDEESENTFLLSNQNIVSTGENCVMVKDANALEFYLSSFENNPIGKEVYDKQGNCLGRVQDVELYGRLVRKIITDKCDFPQKYVMKLGKDYLIFGRPLNNKKSTFKSNLSEKNIEIMPKVSIQENPIILNTESPIRLYANTKNLIGKTLTKDLVGKNNEIIGHNNQKITQKMINKAISHNIFNLLKFYSE